MTVWRKPDATFAKGPANAGFGRASQGDLAPESCNRIEGTFCCDMTLRRKTTLVPGRTFGSVRSVQSAANRHHRMTCTLVPSHALPDFLL